MVHGLSIPLGKLGIHLPRTISAAITSSSTPDSPATPPSPAELGRLSQSSLPPSNATGIPPNQTSAQKVRAGGAGNARQEPARPVWRIGRRVVPTRAEEEASEAGSGTGRDDVERAQR